MIEPDVQILGGDWARLLEDPEATARRAVASVHAHLKDRTPEGRRAERAREVSIVLSDDAHVRDLNRRYRGQDKPTNVLAFPPPAAMSIGAAPGILEGLGDVVLAFETVKQEAHSQNKPLANHMSHLIVHGTLHLLGYDHESDRDAAQMEAEETAILERLGIPDPYVKNTVEEAGTTPDG